MEKETKIKSKPELLYIPQKSMIVQMFKLPISRQFKRDLIKHGEIFTEATKEGYMGSKIVNKQGRIYADLIAAFKPDDVIEVLDQKSKKKVKKVCRSVKFDFIHITDLKINGLTCGFIYYY